MRISPSDPFEGWEPVVGEFYQVSTFWPDKYKCSECGYRFDIGDYFELLANGSLAHQFYLESDVRSCDQNYDLETGEPTYPKRRL